MANTEANQLAYHLYKQAEAMSKDKHGGLNRKILINNLKQTLRIALGGASQETINHFKEQLNN